MRYYRESCVVGAETAIVEAETAIVEAETAIVEASAELTGWHVRCGETARHALTSMRSRYAYL